ncbi:CBO0543 family protein [Sporomusa malonica]|uniref:Uncharacterized protein n=1 Tax=Sporomusa malonica TaxID=112901 RepID=A0A1W2AHV8_9FIRM|nr:CBO0543 family protein [Sporomusa malonica]SMC60082.1 hypothetical protein SAMN04488500_105299 [Sporomusa malonica]
MSKEYWVILALAIASILLLTVFGRRDKPRESLLLLLMAQTVTWPATILLVFAGKIESPIRLFPNATDSNFILAFVFLPTVYVAYYWHYPRNKSRIVQIAHTLAFAGIGTLIHVAVQKYTNLLVYIAFSGYKLWLMGIVSNYVLRIYADWYFEKLAKARSSNS